MRNKGGVVAFTLSVVLVLAIQAFFLSKKVPTIDPEWYDRYANDLELRPGLRYGYVAGMHGAYLVRTPVNGQTHTRTSERKEDSETRSFMARELRRIPRKTVLEAVLYVSTLVFLFFGARPLRRLARQGNPGRLRRLVADALPGAAVFVLFAFPRLLFGYGYGEFTNLAGPGAFSYSGPYFRWEMWVGLSSNSISYRALASVAMLPVGVLVELGWMVLKLVPHVVDLDEIETTGPYWIGGVLFYGAVSVAAIRIIAGIRRRRNLARAAETPSPSI